MTNQEKQEIDKQVREDWRNEAREEQMQERDKYRASQNCDPQFEDDDGCDDD